MDKDFQYYKNNKCNVLLFENIISSMNLYNEIEDFLMTFDEVCNIEEDKKKIETKEDTSNILQHD